MDPVMIVLLIIFLFAPAILLKRYVLGRAASRSLLDSLQAKNYYPADIANLDLAKLNKFKLGQGERERFDEFKYVVARKSDGGGRKYICDIFRKKRVNQARAHMEYYSLYIDNRPLPVDFNVFIRPKYPAFVESMIHMQLSKERGGGATVTEGLSDEFKQKFEVVSIAGTDATISPKLQAALLTLKGRFPFNQLSGQITPMLHIVPEGYSIVSPRINKRENLESLLDSAAALDAALKQ